MTDSTQNKTYLKNGTTFSVTVYREDDEEIEFSAQGGGFLTGAS